MIVLKKAEKKMTDRQDLLNRFHIKEANDIFEGIYDSTLSEYLEKGVFFLERGFVEGLQEEYRPFYDYYDFILTERDRIADDSEMSFLSLLLHRMLEKNRALGGDNIPMLERRALESDEEECDFELCGFFAELAFAPEMAEFYLTRGLPKEYFSATLRDMYETAGIYAYSLTVGRLGYNPVYWDWNQYYIYHKIVMIGSLNFETAVFPDWCVALKSRSGEIKLLAYNKGVTEEGYVLGTLGIERAEFFADFTETADEFIGCEIDTERARITKNKLALPKSEWSAAIFPGDDFLNIHIPRRGKISGENNEFSYREALRLHRIMFPDRDFKAIGCISWLLSAELTELLREDSNILAFANRYMRIPVKADGRPPFPFLFPVTVEKYEDLAESTSLQRRVKELYLSGGSLLMTAGLILI